MIVEFSQGHSITILVNDVLQGIDTGLCANKPMMIVEFSQGHSITILVNDVPLLVHHNVISFREWNPEDRIKCEVCFTTRKTDCWRRDRGVCHILFPLLIINS